MADVSAPHHDFTYHNDRYTSLSMFGFEDEHFAHNTLGGGDGRRDSFTALLTPEHSQNGSLLFEDVSFALPPKHGPFDVLAALPPPRQPANYNNSDARPGESTAHEMSEQSIDFVAAAGAFSSSFRNAPGAVHAVPTIDELRANANEQIVDFRDAVAHSVRQLESIYKKDPCFFKAMMDSFFEDGETASAARSELENELYNRCRQ